MILIMNKVCFPDYDHSILGITTSVLKYYGVKTEYKTIPVLDKALQKGYKNIILWILDGLGVDLISKTLTPRSFLRRHIRDKVSSVFPPTTATATTTYYSGLPPIRHGWAGWSPYFAEYNRCIELFSGLDTYTREPTGVNGRTTMPYRHIFDRITEVAPGVCCTEYLPKKIVETGSETFDDQCRRIKEQTKKDGKQFLLAYWPEPDHTCHHEGTYVKITQDTIRMMNAEIKRLCRGLKDTLVIISADHGHVPVKETFYIDTCPALTDPLAVPLNLDDRVSAIYLKKGKEKDFLKAFHQYLEEDFVLMKSDEALAQGLFGQGKVHEKLSGFLGDYLLIAVGERCLRQRVGKFTSGPEMKSSHAGISKREMIVPLILVAR